MCTSKHILCSTITVKDVFYYNTELRNTSTSIIRYASSFGSPFLNRSKKKII